MRGVLLVVRKAGRLPVWLAGIFMLFCVGMPETAANAAADDKMVAAQDSSKFLDWLKANRDQASGAPYSHVGDARFRHWTITYDAAVVAMAYLAAGETAETRKILDIYIQTPQLWRLGGLIEAFASGDSLQGTDWAVRSGANIWMGIAALRLYHVSKEEKYLDLASKLTDLALSLQDQDQESPNFGGVSMGPCGDPAYEADQHIGYDPLKPAFCDIYASEVSLDAFSLFSLMARVTGELKYSRAASGCLRWLKTNGLNREELRFNRGYRDAVVATDVQNLGVSALGVRRLDTFEPGLAEALITFVEEKCLSTVSSQCPGQDQVRVRGVDFTDKARLGSLDRQPLVSFEWSFQLANAYGRLEKDFRTLGNADKAAKYRQKRERLLSSLLSAACPREDGLAYPYATQSDAVIGHDYRTPGQGNWSIIGAAYAILALHRFDPLRPAF